MRILPRVLAWEPHKRVEKSNLNQRLCYHPFNLAHLIHKKDRSNALALMNFHLTKESEVG